MVRRLFYRSPQCHVPWCTPGAHRPPKHLYLFFPLQTVAWLYLLLSLSPSLLPPNSMFVRLENCQTLIGYGAPRRLYETTFITTFIILCSHLQLLKRGSSRIIKHLSITESFLFCGNCRRRLLRSGAIPKDFKGRLWQFMR